MHRRVSGWHGLVCVLGLVLLGLVLAGGSAGCRSSERSESPGAVKSQSDASQSNALSVVAETEVIEKPGQGSAQIVASQMLPEDPKRIVSMAPNVTEMLFALGLGEKLVGVTRYCDYPAEALALPKIGGMLDPDFEAIVAARPDLVVGVLGGADSRIGKQLDVAKIPYFFVQMDTIEQTFAGLVHIGRVAGDAGAGQQAADTLRQKLAEISGKVAGVGASGEAPKTVLMVYDHEPVVAAGPGTFSHELIEMAGFQNATAGIENPYPVLDIEKVLALNPDILIDATISEGGARAVDFWKQYPALKAVQQGAVRPFADPVLLRPGPRLWQGLERIVQAGAAQ